VTLGVAGGAWWAVALCLLLGTWATAVWLATRSAETLDEATPRAVVKVRVDCPQRFWPGQEVVWARQRFTVRAVDGDEVTLREQGFWMDADDEWWEGGE
jgi:hypothetical protein